MPRRGGSSPGQIVAEHLADVPAVGPKLDTRSQAHLAQVSPPGTTLHFALDPASVTPGGGIGGWEEVAHPKRESTTEWSGTPLRTLTLELVLDENRLTDDVENAVRILNVWGRTQPGWHEPSVLSFGWGTWAAWRWVVNGLEYGETVHNAAGRRTRQAVTVELLEHRTAVLALTPAKRATPAPAPPGKPGKPSSGATPTPSGRVYTVKSGDSLSRIAQRELGKASRWPELARLNGLRDPNRITPGQKLRLPS